VSGAPLEVVAAVVCAPQGGFLLAERPPGKAYAGFWEFPGGKVEPGETLEAAVRRELREELGIAVDALHPWVTRQYTYPHATVRLNFFIVRRWHGELHGREGQRLAWQRLDALDVAPLLPANGPILRLLSLPPVYAVTGLEEWGETAFLERLDAALDAGLRLVQVREKTLSSAALERFAGTVLARCRRHGARVLINDDVALAGRLQADGVHLSAGRAAALDARPALPWVAASCHDAVELARAETLGVDFAALSPVLPTRSHPGAPALGWGAFERLSRGRALPVFALGGLAPADVATAWRHGAHGVACLRAVWQNPAAGPEYQASLI
jgi:8-oxo-dGTP diphosphatase